MCPAAGEILSEFRQPVALMSEEDKEKYLALLKKVLSGAADKNRLDLAFRTAQVADSDEHRLLMSSAIRSFRMRKRGRSCSGRSSARCISRKTI